jgi:integrase
MEEVKIFLDNVHARYHNFFVVAFFAGLRFGEMAALKWKNVDFKLGVIKVRETRVRGEEGILKKTEDGNQRTDDSPDVSLQLDFCLF